MKIDQDKSAEELHEMVPGIRANMMRMRGQVEEYKLSGGHDVEVARLWKYIIKERELLHSIGLRINEILHGRE